MKNMEKKSNPIDPLSLKKFTKTFAADNFHMDRRIFKTLLKLIVKPGYLTLAYFKTSDSIFIQPTKLYFIINFIFFLLTPILTTSQFQIFHFTMESLSKSSQIHHNLVNKQIQAAGVSKEIYTERFNAHLKYNKPALVFLIIPIFSLILKVVNVKDKRHYVEHLVFSIHFLSFFLLLLLILICLYWILLLGLKHVSISSGVAAIIALIVFFVWLSLYLFLAVNRFYKNNKWICILKSVFLITGFIITISLYTQFLFFYSILAMYFGY